MSVMMSSVIISCIIIISSRNWSLNFSALMFFNGISVKGNCIYRQSYLLCSKILQQKLLSVYRSVVVNILEWVCVLLLISSHNLLSFFFFLLPLLHILSFLPLFLAFLHLFFVVFLPTL